mgnify:CR=1 FL=1
MFCVCVIKTSFSIVTNLFKETVVGKGSYNLKIILWLSCPLVISSKI